MEVTGALQYGNSTQINETNLLIDNSASQINEQNTTINQGSISKGGNMHTITSKQSSRRDVINKINTPNNNIEENVDTLAMNVSPGQATENTEK